MQIGTLFFGAGLLLASSAGAAAGEVFVKLPGASSDLSVESFEWGASHDPGFGGWIADVERPQSSADGDGVIDPLTDGLIVLRNTDSAGKVSKVDGFAIKQKATEGSAVSGNTKWKPIKMRPGTSSSATSPGVAIGNKEKLPAIDFQYEVESPRDTASGQASGKRAHEPLVPTNGSILIKLAAPWGGCAAGDRFNGAYFVNGTTHRYRLEGLQVARCSGSEVAFTYETVQPE